MPAFKYNLLKIITIPMMKISRYAHIAWDKAAPQNIPSEHSAWVRGNRTKVSMFLMFYTTKVETFWLFQTFENIGIWDKFLLSALVPTTVLLNPKTFYKTKQLQLATQQSQHSEYPKTCLLKAEENQHAFSQNHNQIYRSILCFELKTVVLNQNALHYLGNNKFHLLIQFQ